MHSHVMYFDCMSFSHRLIPSHTERERERERGRETETVCDGDGDRDRDKDRYRDRKREKERKTMKRVRELRLIIERAREIIFGQEVNLVVADPQETH